MRASGNAGLGGTASWQPMALHPRSFSSYHRESCSHRSLQQQPCPAKSTCGSCHCEQCPLASIPQRVGPLRAKTDFAAQEYKHVV